MDVKKWPAAQVALRKVAELTPYARNSRTHSDAQSALLHPSFYRQIGKDPEVIVAAATARLTERFA